MHPVSAEELVALGKENGAVLVHEGRADDQLGRADVSWRQLAFRIADDGTGALPLLRHVILKDAKSATYKLGLLRAVLRAADGAPGMARPVGDDAVSIPLGLLALNWLRLYLPLIRANLPQTPGNLGETGLGFTKEGWRRIGNLSALDLRAGAVFRGENADTVRKAERLVTGFTGGPYLRSDLLNGAWVTVLVAIESGADPRLVDVIAARITTDQTAAVFTGNGRIERLAETARRLAAAPDPPPMGADGLPVEGEREAIARIAYGIPDVLGRDRADYAGRQVLVVGGGHSAINVVLDLLRLPDETPMTRGAWALRRDGIDWLLGGGLNDQLPERSALGWPRNGRSRPGGSRCWRPLRRSGSQRTATGCG